MGSDTPILDILATHLPAAISSTELSGLPSQSLETLLAFALGADCPARLPDATRHDWSRTQPAALKALQDALGPKAAKRARESHDTDDPTPKRQKTTPDDNDADDAPRFTLPSISTTSPVRKKVDVTVHARSIRFVNPNTRVLEASVPLASITRAFLLPTRGKTKGHWTVVLLPADVPDKAKASPSTAQQVIFGLDALSAAPFKTTSYTTLGTTSTSVFAKGAETASALRDLLSHIPVPLLEPSATVFRSASATPKAGHGAAGIDAYLAAKSGTLWFLDAGILWGESKPCEFWPVGDLLPRDGVRLISATGRTCSVILSRTTAEGKEDGQDAEDGVVETAFSMVDGKEQDPIDAWARHRKHLFGKGKAGAGASSSQAAGSSKEARPTQFGANGTATVKGAAWDDSDSDDGDFEASSEDLGHSSSNEDEDSEGEGGSGAASGGENGSAHSEGVEESGDDSEVEELDPAHHPLLRPGAMPRMSRAAIDKVVDMVHRDLVEDASEEEDELEE